MSRTPGVPVHAIPSILLIDDDRVFCASLKDLLVREGRRVDCAHDGPEALRLLERVSGPVVVVLDMVLATMTASDFLDELARCLPPEKTRTVLVSAHALVTRACLGMDGITERLHKPVDSAEMRQAIARAEEELRLAA